MNVSSTARLDSQAFLNSHCHAARYPLPISTELFDSSVSGNTYREDGDPVYLSGQDRHRRDPSAEAPKLRIGSVAALNLPVAEKEPSASPQVTQNDIVVFAGERGTWQVVAPVNGSKADIRRSDGFDTRVVTAVLENLTVVRYAGSPGSSY